MMIRMKADDGVFLYDILKKTLIPNLSNKFSDLMEYLFAGYEAKGWTYIFEEDYADQLVMDSNLGDSVFKSIASHLYTTILPYLSKDGELTNGISMFLTETKTYTIEREESGTSTMQSDRSDQNEKTNNDSVTSNNNSMEENAPINAEIDSINSPTFKNRNMSYDTITRQEDVILRGNSTGNNSFETTKTDTYTESVDKNETSPEYMKNYFEIRNYLIDCVKREVEKYVYECRLIY